MLKSIENFKNDFVQLIKKYNEISISELFDCVCSVKKELEFEKNESKTNDTCNMVFWR